MWTEVRVPAITTHSVFPISTDYVLENYLLLNSQEFDII